MTALHNPIRYITPCSTSQGSVVDSAPIVLLLWIEGWLTTVIVSLAGGTIYRNLKHLCATLKAPASTRAHEKSDNNSGLPARRSCQ